MSSMTDWRARWRALERQLPNADWSTFRHNSAIVEHIETKPGQLDLWVQHYQSLGLPMGWAEDSGYGSPVLTRVDGVLVTANSLRVACYLKVISEEILSRGGVTIAEIGGGFGALAYAVLRAFPEFVARYQLLDDWRMIHVARAFLHGSLDAPTYAKVFFADFDWRNVDLVINTNSLGEMPKEEVAHYFALMQDDVLGLEDGAAFYTVNRLSRDTDFKAYPYDGKWIHQPRWFFNDRNWVECLSERAAEQGDAPHPVTMLR